MVKFAKPGDPLVHGLGKMEEPDPVERNGQLTTAKVVNTTPVAVEYQPKIRRSLKELNADPQTQAVLNSVLVFQMQGLTINEIAHVLGTSIEEVRHIQNMPAYQETFEGLFREFISANSTSLQARISSYAAKAVDNVMDIAGATLGDKAVPAIVKLKANQDILDRSGLSSDVLFGGGADDDGSNSLNIEITSATDNRTDIKINLKGKR